MAKDEKVWTGQPVVKVGLERWRNSRPWRARWALAYNGGLGA